MTQQFILIGNVELVADRPSFSLQECDRPLLFNLWHESANDLTVEERSPKFCSLGGRTIL
ncbi:MAG: hypothetical protein HY785_00130 [Oscillatoriophycideae cyanobacterium NC_groundwater_1537_Pr4_S-0.65um_50_18]|nr:hypothetical protein [Oscillatoriophycideae cyanobacterium NC_groundwater_1537_Pr4_S-0.65um_50_18]